MKSVIIIANIQVKLVCESPTGGFLIDIYFNASVLAICGALKQSITSVITHDYSPVFNNG